MSILFPIINPGLKVRYVNIFFKCSLPKKMIIQYNLQLMVGLSPWPHNNVTAIAMEMFIYYNTFTKL